MQTLPAGVIQTIMLQDYHCYAVLRRTCKRFYKISQVIKKLAINKFLMIEDTQIICPFCAAYPPDFKNNIFHTSRCIERDDNSECLLCRKYGVNIPVEHTCTANHIIRRSYLPRYENLTFKIDEMDTEFVAPRFLTLPDDMEIDEDYEEFSDDPTTSEEVLDVDDFNFFLHGEKALIYNNGDYVHFFLNKIHHDTKPAIVKKYHRTNNRLLHTLIDSVTIDLDQLSDLPITCTVYVQHGNIGVKKGDGPSMIINQCKFFIQDGKFVQKLDNGKILPNIVDPKFNRWKITVQDRHYFHRVNGPAKINNSGNFSFYSFGYRNGPSFNNNRLTFWKDGKLYNQHGPCSIAEDSMIWYLNNDFAMTEFSKKIFGEKVYIKLYNITDQEISFVRQDGGVEYFKRKDLIWSGYKFDIFSRKFVICDYNTKDIVLFKFLGWFKTQKYLVNGQINLDYIKYLFQRYSL